MNTVKKIVLLGGGHAHLLILSNLRRFRELGCRVSVVQPSPYHYYSGMGPGLLAGMYKPTEIRFFTQKIVQKQDCEFFTDKAETIDPIKRIVELKSGRILKYDFLSCNVGSFVPMEIVNPGAKDVFTVKPIASLLQARERVRELLFQGNPNLAVLGGGPAALEMAAALRALSRERTFTPARITVFTGHRFLSRFGERLRKMGGQTMRSLDIEIVEGAYVKKVDTRKIVLDNGKVYEPDLCMVALGVRPSSLFQTSGLPTGPDQGLLVNKYLQSVAYPEIFGGGDCIYFQPQTLDKVGVQAVRQNPVLLDNLMAMVKNIQLRPFRPRSRYMLIFNTGDQKGILVRGKLVLRGKWVFKLKDRIDRNFMQRFQIHE